jgi:hypothetical protein
MIKEVDELVTKLQGHPELVAEDEKERLIPQERFFYNRSQKLV